MITMCSETKSLATVVSVTARSRDPGQEEMSWHAESRNTDAFTLHAPSALNVFDLKYKFRVQAKQKHMSQT